jgi:hypothetical protein
MFYPTASHVVIGMLFAGGLKYSFSYFTPIEVLFEDIKEVTKKRAEADAKQMTKMNGRETSMS